MTNISATTRHNVSIRRPAPGFLATLFGWGKLREQRLDLSRLDDNALNDIGVTYEEAQKESRKPFWMMPNFR